MPTDNSGWRGKQLGQLRPANTTAATIYTPADRFNVNITSITIANTSGSAATYRLFHDEDGTTYDATTALKWDINLPADTSVEIDLNLWMADVAGNIAVRTSVNSALTFTLYGKEWFENVSNV